MIAVLEKDRRSRLALDRKALLTARYTEKRTDQSIVVFRIMSRRKKEKEIQNPMKGNTSAENENRNQGSI